jgi:hypothetical protein
VKDDSRNLLALKSGHDYALSFIAEEVNSVGIRQIIEHDFRHNVHVRATAQNDLIPPHGEILSRWRLMSSYRRPIPQDGIAPPEPS